MRTVLIVSIIGALLLTACTEGKDQRLVASESATSKAAAMSAPILLNLGESGRDFSNRYPGLVRVSHQPAGLDFFSARWTTSPRPTVKVNAGSNSFHVEHVLSVQSAQELGPLASEGLYEFTINAGLSEPTLISHDEARVKTYAILSELVRSGWRPLVERSEPRVRGRARFEHTMATESVNGLDPDYVPTLDEWMQIESRTPWMFHASGAYLAVTFTREATMTDVDKPGAYMMTFTIQTEAEHFRGYVGSDDRVRWRALVPSVLAGLAEDRVRKEHEFRVRGIPVDEAYVDPPVPQPDVGRN